MNENELIEVDLQTYNKILKLINNGNTALFFSSSIKDNVIPIKIRNKKESDDNNNIVIEWLNNIKKKANDGIIFANKFTYFNAIIAYCDAILDTMKLL